MSRFRFIAHLEAGGTVVKSARSNEMTLRLVGSGERGSFLDDVYRRYCRYVGAVILRLGGRRDEIEDLIQDVFVEASRGIRELREPDAVKGWLATIAVRLVRRRLRWRRLRRFLGLDGGADYSHLVDPAASPVDKLLLRSVYRVLDELAVDDRVAFSLHVIEGETVEEIARLCGCSLATAKRRIARAQREIEQRLADE
jgi:RNA polymerase sigma-70 factor (ECF subfamily)